MAYASIVGESMVGPDDRHGDVERAGGDQCPAHGRDVGFDRAGSRDDRAGSLQCSAERRTIERHVLSDPADVANRPTALGGGDVRAGAAVADGQICRLAGALREPVEVGLCRRDQPIERRAASQPCSESQRCRPGGEVAARIAIDIPRASSARRYRSVVVGVSPAALAAEVRLQRPCASTISNRSRTRPTDRGTSTSARCVARKGGGGHGGRCQLMTITCRVLTP